MQTCVVFPSTGLGDIIMASGLIRKQLESDDRVVVVVRKLVGADVKPLFRDEPRIVVDPIPFGKLQKTIATRVWKHLQPLTDQGFVRMMYPHICGPGFGLPVPAWDFKTAYDEYLYTVVGEQPSVKFTHFKYVPDIQREDALKLELLGAHTATPYAFVHDKPEARIPLDQITPGLRIIRPVKKPGWFFDYGKLIADAAEVHVIDSAFLHMIDLRKLRTEQLHFWDLYRFYPNGRPRRQLNWTVHFDKKQAGAQLRRELAGYVMHFGRLKQAACRQVLLAHGGSYEDAAEALQASSL